MLGTKRLLDSLLVRSTQSEVVTAHNYSIQEPTNRAGNIQDEGSCSGQPASLCKAKFASLSCKDLPPNPHCFSAVSSPGYPLDILGMCIGKPLDQQACAALPPGVHVDRPRKRLEDHCGTDSQLVSITAD